MTHGKSGSEIVARICLLLRTMPALAQRPIYTQGDIASEMYIVLKGHLQVTFQSNRSNDGELHAASKTHYEMMKVASRKAQYCRRRNEGWVDWADGEPFVAYMGGQTTAAVPATPKRFTMECSPLKVVRDVPLFNGFDVEKEGRAGTFLRPGLCPNIFHMYTILQPTPSKIRTETTLNSSKTIFLAAPSSDLACSCDDDALPLSLDGGLTE